jgi:hypothetical protein
VQVKGTAIVVLQRFVRERFGQDAFKEWLGQLDPETQTVYGGEILASEWYPYKEVCLEPTALMCEMFYNRDSLGAWELGRFSADYGLHGVYKTFLKPDSVQNFIKRCSIILPTYYSPCRMDIVEIGEKRGVVRLVDFAEVNELLEVRIAGWIQRALELHGCQEVRVDITSALSRRQPYTEYVGAGR